MLFSHLRLRSLPLPLLTQRLSLKPSPRLSLRHNLRPMPHLLLAMASMPTTVCRPQMDLFSDH